MLRPVKAGRAAWSIGPVSVRPGGIRQREVGRSCRFTSPVKQEAGPGSGEPDQSMELPQAHIGASEDRIRAG